MKRLPYRTVWHLVPSAAPKARESHGSGAGPIRDLTGRPLREIVFTGGAAKGRLWPQILADVLDARVRVPVVKESTALGAAIYVGLGAGLFGELGGVLEAVVRFERAYEPDPATHEQYRALHDQWSAIYAHSLAFVQGGLLRPLWQAAGVPAVP